MELYVDNILPSASDKQVRVIFEECGTVESVTVIRELPQCRQRPYGFVVMPNQEEAMRAIENKNGGHWGHARLFVRPSRPSDHEVRNEE